MKLLGIGTDDATQYANLGTRNFELYLCLFLRENTAAV